MSDPLHTITGEDWKKSIALHRMNPKRVHNALIKRMAEVKASQLSSAELKSTSNTGECSGVSSHNETTAED